VPDEVDLTIVSMAFDASEPDALLAVLSRYVVVSRGHAGCRNIDFTASATRPGRFVVIEKWETPADQQRHFDSDEMVGMAKACDGLLSQAPIIDLLQPISAHDLL
jgi:quinol monooxygenase YgiN